MRRALLSAALVLGTTVTQANDGLFYVGAGITSNSVNSITVPGSFTSSPNIDGTSWKAFAGFRPISLFAVEADYIDMGGQSQSMQSVQACVSGGFCSISSSADAKAVAAYAVGFLPIPVPMLDVYGKIGLARYDLSGNVTYVTKTGGTSFSLPGNSTELAWGAGAQVHVGKLGVRLEYEGIDKASTQVFSLSIYLNLL